MKQVLLLLLISQVCHAQKYAKIESIAYNTKTGVQPGGEISAGYIFKTKESQKRNYQVGIGTSLYYLNSRKPYVPVFAEAGYFNSFDKITPYVSCRAGYSFYKGLGNFVEVDTELHGGVYMSVRTGAGFKLNRNFSIAPFLGLSYIQLRDKAHPEETVDYYETLLNAGIAIVIF